MPNYRKDYSLYKRGKVWYYRTYDAEGNRTPGRSTGETNKNRAEQYCNRQLAAGKLVPQRVPTLAEWAAERSWWVWGECKYLNGKLLRSEEGKPAVSRRYADDAARVLRDRILPVHGEKRLDDITTDELEVWLFDWCDEGFKHKTINNWASVYRIMLGEAFRLGLIDRNPWDRVLPLSETTTPRGILTLEEAKKLLNPLNVAKYWEENHLAYTVNLTAALTALRQGEILAIQTGDVHPEYLHIEHSWHRKYDLSPTKNKVVADVPIPPVLFAQIVPYTEYNSPYVFSLDGGKRPYTAGKTATWLYRAMRNIGISDSERESRHITFHSWRAWFNTNLRAAGIPDATIRRVTRHKTEQMTDHYTRFNPEHFREVVQVQQRLLN